MSTDTARVLGVIGTGNPLDAIFMIPLIHGWHATRACALVNPEPCERMITRIVTLSEPGFTDDTGFTSYTLAFCEQDFQTFTEPKP